MRETKPLKWMNYFVGFVHGAKATVLMKISMRLPCLLPLVLLSESSDQWIVRCFE